jgi:hypothetical protein
MLRQRVAILTIEGYLMWEGISPICFRAILRPIDKDMSRLQLFRSRYNPLSIQFFKKSQRFPIN